MGPVRHVLSNTGHRRDRAARRAAVRRRLVGTAHVADAHHSHRYHRNYYVNDTYNYFNNTLRQQGVDPTRFTDPFLNRTFGAAIAG